MMQTFYAFVIVILFTVNLRAQSFNYEDVTVQYVLPAKTPFKTDFKTITVRFHGEEHLKRYGILPSDLVSKEFKFERYKNVPAHGDLHLDVFVGMPEYLGVKKEKGTRTENNVEVTYHYYDGTVITPMTYELRDGARNLIEEKIVFTATDHHHFTSYSYSTVGELEKAWEEGKNITISKKTTEILRNSLGEVALELKDRFDDQIIQKVINIFDLKKADKIHAEFLNTAFSKISSGLIQNPLLAKWDESKKTEIRDLLTKGTKFGIDDNDERVAYAIAHYNLAVLSLFWNDIPTAKSHILKGKKAERKIESFEEIEKLIASMDHRGESDEISAKEYVAQYQEGSDSKLPAIATAVQSTGSVTEDFSAKKARSVDTVYVKNGDKIIGYVTAVHTMKRLPDSEIHDFSHLLISPLNMSQKEIKIEADDIVYIRTKDTYMLPLPTRIPLILSPPIHLYEPVQVSKDGRLGLLRTAYHESMPYHLNDADERVYLYTYRAKTEGDEFEILSITGGTKYVLGLNGGLANDFEFCHTIVTKANNKHYVLEEVSLKGLVDDYDKCRN